MASRADNLAIIHTYGGVNTTLDDVVHDAVTDNLGLDALTDEAIALMAAEYQRLAQAKGFFATFDDTHPALDREH
ncbi:MAG TPA: hypothetical protein VEZ12_20860 [Herpetosiphonaceae bacterium]|nr:hypothetical protein [Herpetosiphonaceae bacterium]